MRIMFLPCYALACALTIVGMKELDRLFSCQHMTSLFS
jgi:hypothetical protein